MISLKKIKTGNSEAFKTVGIYTFSNFFTKAISFASLPLFTYLLTEKDFGVISIFNASIFFLMPFVSLSILYSTSTDYFKLNKNQFASFVTTTFFLPIIVALITGIIFLIFFKFLENKISFDPLFIWMLPVVVYCNFLIDQIFTLMRNNNEPKLYMWLCILKILIEIGVAVFLIGVLHYGWEGRIFGIFLSFAACAVFSVFYLKKNGYLSGKIDFSIVKKEVIYSLPVITTQLSFFCFTASDKYFINYYFGEERNGIYSLAATFASIISIFCAALSQYYFPKIYSYLSQNHNGAMIKKMFWQYCKLILLMLLILVGFTMFSYSYLVNQRFIYGLPYFFLLVIGNTIWGVAYFLYSFIFYHKAKTKTMFISLAGIGISFLFNSILIRKYGEIGAGVASICTYLLVFLLIFFSTRKLFFGAI